MDTLLRLYRAEDAGLKTVIPSLRDLQTWIFPNFLQAGFFTPYTKNINTQIPKETTAYINFSVNW